ncbi:MAG TPA: DUF4249 domain-containing protein [Puia sp.]
MKTLKFLQPFCMLVFLFSCTKVISVNLNNANPNIVIEGIVSDGPGPYQVKITQTVNFSDPNVFPPITGATIKITDSSLGITDSLKELAPGTYVTQKIQQGITGHTYQLYVLSNGQTYTASSTMPAKVNLDSVTFYITNIFGTKSTSAIANFQDPAGIANYYTFTEYVNGQAINQTFNFSDRLSDGKYIRRQLFNDSSYINPGDQVAVEMHCVDNQVWQYFNTLGQAKGNNSQAITPANPLSNISNNALGYFSAQTVQTGLAILE